MVAISFDLENTFDHLWRHKILSTLEERKIKGNLATSLPNGVP